MFLSAEHTPMLLRYYVIADTNIAIKFKKHVLKAYFISFCSFLLNPFSYLEVTA